jgi:hypothetical protein
MTRNPPEVSLLAVKDAKVGHHAARPRDPLPAIDPAIEVVAGADALSAMDRCRRL